MNTRSSNGRGSFKVYGGSDVVKVMDMVIARSRQGRDLFREGKICVKDETKIMSRIGRLMEGFDGREREWLVILDICRGRPIRMNSD